MGLVLQGSLVREHRIWCQKVSSLILYITGRTSPLRGGPQDGILNHGRSSDDGSRGCRAESFIGCVITVVCPYAHGSPISPQFSKGFGPAGRMETQTPAFLYPILAVYTCVPAELLCFVSAAFRNFNIARVLHCSGPRFRSGLFLLYPHCLPPHHLHRTNPLIQMAVLSAEAP